MTPSPPMQREAIGLTVISIAIRTVRGIRPLVLLRRVLRRILLRRVLLRRVLLRTLPAGDE